MPKPVSPGIHRTIDFLSVLLLLAAGPLFGFKGTPAEITSTLAGAVLVYSVFTWWVKMITLKAHLVIDAGIAIAMVFAPFHAGFSDVTPARNFFIAFGAASIVIVLLTEPEARRS